MNFAGRYSTIVFFLTFVGATRADVLGQWTANTTGLGVTAYLASASPPVPPPNRGFHFFFGGNGAGGTGSIDIGDSAWSPSAVGSTTVIDSSTPNFNAVAALLTDGIDENIGFGMTPFSEAMYLPGIPLSTLSESESTAFDLPIASPDFSGDQITSIQFQLNSFSWITTGPISKNAYTLQPQASFTESIIGSVPEPAAALPAIAALSALFLARPRRFACAR
jgi:hypothetical protein